MSVALPNTIAYDPPAFINSTFEELKMPKYQSILFSVKKVSLVLIVRTVPVATEYSSVASPASSKNNVPLRI
jgi:hypothetical protein